MTRYEQGFLSKCAEHGIAVDFAVKMLKKAENTEQDYDEDDIRRKRKNVKLLSGIGAGALVGGMFGQMSNLSAPWERKTKLKDAILKILAGASIGGLAGGTLAHLSNRASDYAGLDPMSIGTVKIQK